VKDALSLLYFDLVWCPLFGNGHVLSERQGEVPWPDILFKLDLTDPRRLVMSVCEIPTLSIPLFPLLPFHDHHLLIFHFLCVVLVLSA